MASIFSKIANREIPSFKVAESNRYYAFLDINPIVKGHTLVIPKKETDYIFDIEDVEFQDFMLFAKRVAEGIKLAIPCKRVGMAVIGMEVPHAHIHLIPLNNEGDLNFKNPKLNISSKEMNEIAELIASKI